MFSGLSFSEMFISPGTLQSGRKYRVQVSVQLTEGKDGYTLYDFETNTPPYGGNCTVTPPTGRVWKF